MNSRIDQDKPDCSDVSAEEEIYVYEVCSDLTDDPEHYRSCLQHCTPGNKRRHGVSNIASALYYVHKDVLLEDLVDELNRHATLLAVGVVGDDNEALGVIVRRELFNILGRSYGDEFSRSKTAASIARHVVTFHYEANIFSIAREIEEELMGDTMEYFMLVDRENRFNGIFSTKDLLVSLAGMTRRDMDTAASIQSGIVNEMMTLDEHNFELTASAQMAQGVGGDFYSVRRIDSSRWFIAIADVSGKGIGAAFLTAVLGALVHSSDFKKGISDFLIKLNEYIEKTFSYEKFLTGLFCTLNEKTGLLNVYDMGHSLLYLHRGGKLLNVKSPHDNLPIGISSDIMPRAGNIKLRENDIIVMATDGVLEQFNSMREEYGFYRLEKVISENADKSLEDIRNSIIEDLNAYKGFEPRHDDVTFILVRYRGGEAETG